MSDISHYLSKDVVIYARLSHLRLKLSQRAFAATLALCHLALTVQLGPSQPLSSSADDVEISRESSEQGCASNKFTCS